ncbi:MAG: YihA family ribosome biogenesis GTP-binding protein [Deltaproteobacteria bacterium]|nr:YihA family ribosome biogenesis GTP-binding protein [Deltaproteobacteria bacterium]
MFVLPGQPGVPPPGQEEVLQLKNVRFVTSAVDLGGVPVDDRPQVAFAGRSNVGKSSLINSLLQRRGLARTSSKPGHTRMINFFLVNEAFYLVDLPGYGYATVDRRTRASWGPLVHAYLEQETRLRLVVVLLDMRRELTAGDRQLLAWLQMKGLPLVPVLTKADKFRAAQRARQRRQWEAALAAAGVVEKPVSYSVTRKMGREELLARLAAAVGPDAAHG